MRIRRKWVRDLASIVFSLYYLVAAEQADEKVRKMRGMLTVDHLRVSWNKPTTPYLRFFTKLLRPRLARYPPRAIRIPRPRDSSYKDHINAWLYFDGPLTALRDHTRVVLDVPGGGFVAMNPRTNDDKLLAWAGKTGLPILSLDYRKAPEFPYPYALNEIYDTYHTIVASRGRCVGLSGEVQPKILITGDSAGGNLATAAVLMILQSSSDDSQRLRGSEALPPPDGLMLIYPGLTMNIGNWMTDEQMTLIKDRRMRKTNKSILRRKSEDYNKLTPSTPHISHDEDEATSPPLAPAATKPMNDSPVLEPPAAVSPSVAKHTASVAQSKPQQLKTRLAMSSMISYFNDRILTPEMMRAMIILYVGPHHRPDFATDFLLSPLLAPESLLARFPKTYFLTGERDPLVDDTVIFAGRLRQAAATRWQERKELGLLSREERKAGFQERNHVEVALIPGISHGFMQFVSVFPEGWKHIFRCATWIEEAFDKADARDRHKAGVQTPGTESVLEPGGEEEEKRYHQRLRTESSGDEDRPLEMSMMAPSSSARGGRANGLCRGRGRGRGRERKPQVSRTVSNISLASEDDLLSKRMRQLAGGLLGEEREE